MIGEIAIRNAELQDGRIADVLILDGRISAIGRDLATPSHRVIAAAGGLLLPGLHDHHIHVAALAAAMNSIRCGPPDLHDRAELASALDLPGNGWLRGTGYHESVAGLIDRHWLDWVCGHRPVRIQHRSGRLWIFNSLGLERLLASNLAPPPGLERDGGGWTGRLYDEDEWARIALRGTFPNLAPVGSDLARMGVTGVTEISPANDDDVAAHFADAMRAGDFPQRILMAGSPNLGRSDLDPMIGLGPVKLHLHEAHLPDFDATVAIMREAHMRGRAVATHCVTTTELAFTLAAHREAGALPGDRIEHASIASDAMVSEIADLGLSVVTQPNFVAERGDAYLAAVPREEHPHLYRLRAFLAAGVAMAGGSDAPFGQPDPWKAMAAAITRRTSSGHVLGSAEALTPDEALNLFLADPTRLDRSRRLETGGAADFCLLSQPWARAQEQLCADLVRATIIGGQIVYQSDHAAI